MEKDQEGIVNTFDISKIQEEEEDLLYKMELHDAIKIDSDLWVIRVPGGWIYKHTGFHSESIAFVPFSSEYQNQRKGKTE